MAKLKTVKKKYTPRLGDVVFVKDNNGKVNRNENFIYLRKLSISELIVLSKVPISKNTFKIMTEILGHTPMSEYDTFAASLNSKDGVVDLHYLDSSKIVPDIITTVQLQKEKTYSKFVKSLMRKINKDFKQTIKEMPEDGTEVTK